MTLLVLVVIGSSKSTGPIETETIIASDYLGRLSNGVTSTTNVTEVHGATDLQPEAVMPVTGRVFKSHRSKRESKPAPN